jgi:hypothetical protein
MKPFILVAAMALIATATPVPAQLSSQPPPPITVYGNAAVICQVWLNEPQTGPDHIAHQQWLLGYVSGYDMFVANNESLVTSNDGIIGYLDNVYCPNRPNDTIAAAGAALVDDTRRRISYPSLHFSSPPAIQYSN